MVRPSTAPAPSRNKLSADAEAKLAQLYDELAVLEKKADYKKASKIYENILKLQATTNNRAATAAKRTRRKLCDTVENQERDALNLLERKHQETLEEFDSTTKNTLRRLREDNATKRHDLGTTMREEFQNRRVKFPPEILQLKELEFNLCRMKEYERANLLQKELEVRTKEVREAQVKSYEKDIDIAKKNMKRLQQKGINTYMERRKDMRGLIIEKYDREVDHVRAKFSTAKRSVDHAFTLQQRLSKDGLPIDHQAQVSLQRCNVSMSAATCTVAESIRDVRLEKHQMPRATTSQRRSRKIPLKPIGNKCDSCAKLMNARATVYSIPKDYLRKDQNVKGVGRFCSWECASVWNQRKSPIQLRWVRELFIKDAMKQLKEPVQSTGKGKRRSSTAKSKKRTKAKKKTAV